jgi:hypothetical protein
MAKKLTLLQKITPKRPLHIQILFTAISFLAMAVLSYIFMNSIVHDHLVRNTEAVLSFQKASLETRMVEFRTPLEIISWEARSMILCGESAQSLRDYFVNIYNHFYSNEKYRLSVNGLAGFFETFPDGPTFITSLENQNEIFYSEEQPWYAAAIRAGGEIAETVVYKDIFAGEAILVYSRCIYDDEGRRLGAVGLRVIVGAMGREVVETALAQGGHGMLISRDLIVSAHPNQDFVGRNLHELGVAISEFTDDLRNGMDISERPVITFRNEAAVAFSVSSQTAGTWAL